jgi:hypothetical protein
LWSEWVGRVVVEVEEVEVDLVLVDEMVVPGVVTM